MSKARDRLMRRAFTILRGGAMERYQHVVDGHCDTLTSIMEQNMDIGRYAPEGQLDLPRMLWGGINVQFFAAFISPRFRDLALKKCLHYIDVFYTAMEKNSSVIEPARNAGDILRINGTGKLPPCWRWKAERRWPATWVC